MRQRKQFVSTILLLLPMLLVLIGGCAGKQLTFVKAGSENADVQRDKDECLRSAIGTSHHGAEVLVPYCIDRDVFIQCMEAHGYAVRPD